MNLEFAAPRRSRRLVLLMIATAVAALEVAMSEPDTPRTIPLLRASAWAAAMVGGFVWRGRLASRAAAPTGGVLAVLLLFCVMPVGAELVRLATTGRTAPWETPLLGVLRNLGMGLAALGHWPLAVPLAALASLFLALIAAALGDDPAVLSLVGLFALVGTLWLVDSHWSRLTWAVVTPVGGRPARRRRPVGALVLAFGFVGVVVAVAAAGPSRAATVLAALIPSSGGTDINDPDARGGVNDGDNEVGASEHPQSIGFTESEVYLESDKSSLYDSFSEQYGEPVKPKNKQERMVSLAPQDAEARAKPTENHQAGRTFAAVRQPRSRPSRLGSERAARALFYVKGPTPLHVPLATYDRFDGVEWAEEPPCDQHCPIEPVPGRGSWLRIDRMPSRIFGGLVTHQIKVGTLDSSPLPVPAHVDRFKVGSVARPEFFGWAQWGLIRMVGRTVPAGTTIDTESRTVSPRRLRAAAFETPRAASPSRFLALAGPIRAEVVQLIGSWVRNIPRGWDQVEAVVAGVRHHCQFDPAAHAPGDCDDVVAHFLLDSRCGPDHHFASAAAVALRFQGYPTRVVCGFYAGPAAYDARTRHTPVGTDDVHFWCEVQLPGGPWVAVEPTPGYELMPPVLDLDEQVMAALRALVARARSHAGVIASILVAGPALVWRRRRARAALATLWWRLNDRGPVRRRVLRAAALIELRARLAGLARPAGQTPTRWFGRVAQAGPETPRGELDRLLLLADRARYAAVGTLDSVAPPDDEVAAACRRAIRGWTLRRFESLRHPARPEGSLP